MIFCVCVYIFLEKRWKCISLLTLSADDLLLVMHHLLSLLCFENAAVFSSILLGTSNFFCFFYVFSEKRSLRSQAPVRKHDKRMTELAWIRWRNCILKLLTSLPSPLLVPCVSTVSWGGPEDCLPLADFRLSAGKRCCERGATTAA